MATTPIPALLDTVNSFYQFILTNVTQINPSRKFGGIVEARDWPPKEIVPAVPYLAPIRDTPTRTKQSFYDLLVTSVLEWRWILVGDNIPANVQAANRGDKYVQNVQIMQELLSAHNPGYAPKNQYSLTNDVNNNPVLVATPYTPPDFLWWSIPAFARKQDKQTGLIYTAGQVEVSSYGPVSSNLG